MANSSAWKGCPFLRGRFVWVGLVVGLLFIQPAFGIDRAAHTCRKSLLKSLVSWFHDPILRKDETSLQIGIPPGVFLDNREILKTHIQWLVEEDTGPFPWVRLLAWPVRRALGNRFAIETIQHSFHEPVWVRLQSVSDMSFTALVGTGHEGRVSMLIQEVPYDDEGYLYLCTSLITGRWWDDRGDDRDEILTPQWPDGVLAHR